MSSEVRGKIAIIGYDGDKQPLIVTPIGKVRAHEMFSYALQSIYEQLAATGNAKEVSKRDLPPHPESKP